MGGAGRRYVIVLVVTPRQFASLASKTLEAATAGQYELYKTSAHFDSTVQHPDWPGGESPAVEKLAPQNT
jgi:hypothetical protein